MRYSEGQWGSRIVYIDYRETCTPTCAEHDFHVQVDWLVSYPLVFIYLRFNARNIPVIEVWCRKKAFFHSIIPKGLVMLCGRTIEIYMPASHRVPASIPLMLGGSCQSRMQGSSRYHNSDHSPVTFTKKKVSRLEEKLGLDRFDAQ